jgi:hypothetical protein
VVYIERERRDDNQPTHAYSYRERNSRHNIILS